MRGGDTVSELFTTSRTAQILDISTQTLKRWYKWYNSTDFEKPKELKLPEPKIDGKKYEADNGRIKIQNKFIQIRT